MSQIAEMKDSLTFYKPELFSFIKDGIHFFVFGEGPNWISTGEKGAKVLNWVDCRKSFGEIVNLYSGFYDVDLGKSWRGVLLDNYESLKLRANGRPFIKYDLGNLCLESLCLYIDGHIYPSAATAGETGLSLGDARKNTVKSLWLDSPVSQTFQGATVAGKVELENNPFRFITGGGDMEHSYFFSSNGQKGDILGEDPYYELYVETIKDILTELALNKKNAFNLMSGFNPPVIYHAMGDDAISCSEDALNWINGQAPQK